MPNQPLMIISTPGVVRCTTLALALALTSPLLAQSVKATQTSSPQADQSALMQVQILTNRVAMLEQKLAAFNQRLTIDEASSTNNPQSAVPVTGDEPPSAPSSGLSKADQARLANMEQQIQQLQAPQKGDTRGVPHPNRVVAPFQVVGANGRVLMSVEDQKSGVAGGMKVYAPDGSYVQVGPGKGGWSAVRVYAASAATPRLFMGMEDPSLAGISVLDNAGKVLADITEVEGNGELDISNSSGQVVTLIGANPVNGEGHAKFMDTAGVPLAIMGAAGDHGDVILYGEGGYRIPVWEFAYVAPIL